MQRTAIRRCVLAGIVVLLTVASLPAVQASPAVSDSGSAPDPVSVQSTGQGSDVPFDSDDGEEGELEEDENGADEDEDEDGISIVGEWWGLGGEASEAPYIGLVELGVTVLAVGVTGYSLGKRTSILPVRFRGRLLQAHEWTMLLGTALVVPHFVAVEEWEGLGLLVAFLLAVEVLSGLYGRHLHRHVIRLGRGEETASLAGRALDVTKATLLVRWRRLHVSLTLLTALVVVAHVVIAVGD